MHLLHNYSFVHSSYMPCLYAVTPHAGYQQGEISENHRSQKRMKVEKNMNFQLNNIKFIAAQHMEIY